MPLGEGKAILNRTTFSEIIVEAQSVNDINLVVNLIQEIYGNELSVVSVQQLINTVSTITSGYSFLLVAVVSISLFVGAVGIMGIMLSRVYQRIREIGMMKTLGLTTRDVLLVFLAESGIIGGAIGVALGIGGSFIFDILASFSSSSTTTSSAGGDKGVGRFTGGGGFSITSFKRVISPEAVAIALGVAIIVSLIAGIYPALRAAKLTVIDAIRRD